MATATRLPVVTIPDSYSKPNFAEKPIPGASPTSTEHTPHRSHRKSTFDGPPLADTITAAPAQPLESLETTNTLALAAFAQMQQWMQRLESSPVMENSPEVLSLLIQGEELLGALETLAAEVDDTFQSAFKADVSELRARFDGPVITELMHGLWTPFTTDLNFWAEAVPPHRRAPEQLLGTIYKKGVGMYHVGMLAPLEEYLETLGAEVVQTPPTLRPKLEDVCAKWKSSLHDCRQLCFDTEATMAHTLCEQMLPHLTLPKTDARHAARIMIDNLLHVRARVLTGALVLSEPIALHLEKVRARLIKELQGLIDNSIVPPTDIALAFRLSEHSQAGETSLADLPHFYSNLSVVTLRETLAYLLGSEKDITASLGAEILELLRALPLELQQSMQKQLAQIRDVACLQRVLEEALTDPDLAHCRPGPLPLKGETPTVPGAVAPTSATSTVTPQNRQVLEQFREGLLSVLRGAYGTDPAYAPYRNFPRSDTIAQVLRLERSAAREFNGGRDALKALLDPMLRIIAQECQLNADWKLDALILAIERLLSP